MILNLITSNKKLSFKYLNNYFVIDGIDNGISNEPFGVWTYGPNCQYYNGSTYYTFKRHIELDQKAIICKYDGNSVTSQIVSNFPTSSDYHNHPTLAIDSIGYIYLIDENHSYQPRIYKSDNPEDISSFSALSLTGMIKLDYPKTACLSDGFIMIGRTKSDYGITALVSDNGVSWTNYKISIAESESGLSGSYDPRHYPEPMINWVQDNFIHFAYTKRVSIADPTLRFPFPYMWKIKTPYEKANRGKVWYNDAETFSKNVSSSGPITEAELTSNCLVWSETSYVNRGVPISNIWNGEFIGQMYRTDFLGRKLYKSSELFDCNFDFLIPSNNKIHAMHNLELDEYGINELKNDYTLSKRNPVYEPSDGILYIRYPFNLDKIPSGNKFVIVAGTRKNGCVGHSSCSERNDVIAWECEKK
jgi:hypothetical protein